jgi:hypothetical protein
MKEVNSILSLFATAQYMFPTCSGIFSFKKPDENERGIFMKFVTIVFILSLTTLFTACSPAAFKSNYGDLNDPSAEQALREIAKESDDIVEYSSKIFKSSSFPDAVYAEDDDYIYLSYFQYNGWGFSPQGKDPREELYDRAFRIYCDVKYSAKQIGEEAFCAETIDYNSFVYIRRTIDIYKRFDHLRYDYGIRYREYKKNVGK